MEWQLVLLIIFGSLIVLMATGLPVAFCFLGINIAAVILLWGGSDGLIQLVYSMWFTLATFVYLPITMFVLLGEIVFHSGMAIRAIDALDKWLGRLPGRLGLLAVACSTMFSTMSGSTIATTAMLGEALLPEMQKRGYKPVISIGSIAGSGGLAMMIPPSSPAVVLASIAEISVGKVLISGIFPGLVMAVFYAGYVVIRCWLQPHLAPPYDVKAVPLSEKISAVVKYVLPLSFIVFMVTGLIFLGVATPSEAAVMGVLGGIILAAIYKQLSWRLLKGSFVNTVKISAMILLILSASQSYSQILAFTGAAREWVKWVMTIPMPPLAFVAGMLIVLLIMGCFMSGLPLMMISLPLFMPVIKALHFDPIWFALMFLLAVEIGQETPPFGVVLFTMKGVAPPGTTMMEIIKADLPYIFLDLAVLAIILLFPPIATWLPNNMFSPTG